MEQPMTQQSMVQSKSLPLQSFFLILAATAFVSSVINWVASNWEQFSRLQKLYGMQGLVACCLVGAVFYFFQAAKQPQDTTLRHKRSVAFFCLAMSLGALFALFGQTYQTGADTWQLFAIWALVQIPLLLLSFNFGSTILLIITLNLALHFYLSLWSDTQTELLSLLALNAMFVFLSEKFSARLQDSHRLFARSANLILILSTLLPFLTTYDVLFKYIEYRHLFILCFGAGLAVYIKLLRDHFISALYFFPIVALVDAELVMNLAIEGIIFSIILSIAAATFFAKFVVDDLKKQGKMHSNWTLTPLFILITLLVIGLCIVWLFLSGVEQTGLLVFSGIGLVIGWITLKNSTESASHHLLPNIILGVSLVLGCIGSYTFGHEPTGLFSVALFFHFVIHILRTALWIRIFSWFALFYIADLFILNLITLWEEFPFAISASKIFGTLLIFAFAKSENQIHQRFLIPFAWATLLFATMINIPFRFLGLGFEGFNLSNEPVDVFSWQAFFQMMFSYPNINALLVNATSLFALLLWGKRNSLSKAKMVGLTLLAIGLTGWLIGMPNISWMLALIIIAYARNNRILLAVTALIALLFTWNFYYYAGIPFLYKSIYMLILAVIALCGYIVLKASETQENSEKRPLVKKDWYKLATLGFVALGSLFSVYNKMQTYEHILDNGNKIILALAPVDPRSLMQGDYMTLNYAILDEISSDEKFKALLEERKHFAYALLNRNEQGVGYLVDIQESVIERFEIANADAYIPIHFNQHNIRLPSQEFFFPEGKADHYAKARYAVYRFDKGVALLAQLLDKDLKPL